MENLLDIVTGTTQDERTNENQLDNLPNLNDADLEFILNCLNNTQPEEQFGGEKWDFLDEIIDDSDGENINGDEESEEEEDGGALIENVVVNRCTICHTDLGPANPRQLCGKTRCLQIDYVDLTQDEDNENSWEEMSIDFTVDSSSLVPWVDMDSGLDTFEMYIEPYFQ